MNRGGPPPPPGPRRERRWQTSQERARVAAELIEEAESLTQTGAIASPTDVTRDNQPPPLRVAQGVATPGPQATTAKLDDGELEPPAPLPAPPPLPPSSTTAAPEPPAPAAPDDPLYVAARDASERGEVGRAEAYTRDVRARDPRRVKARNDMAVFLDSRSDRDG